MRRAVSGAALGMAVLGASFTGGGAASADEGHHKHGPSVEHNEVSQGKGSLVYAPVNANVCGNTVNAVGLLNPAFGNTCTAQSGIGDQSSTESSPSFESPSTVPELPTS